MRYIRLTGRCVRMPDYRLYCLDGAGRITLADWIQAETDEEAIEKARKKQQGARKCEIWQRRRLVETLDAQDLS
jgi:hypothetical protein